MMANIYRGEVALELAGQTHCLRLSLNALARLEKALDVPNLSALIAKLATPDLSLATVQIVLIEALVAGSDLGADQARHLIENDGSPVPLTRAYIDLVRLTFLEAEHG